MLLSWSYVAAPLTPHAHAVHASYACFVWLCNNTNTEDTRALHFHTHLPGHAKQHRSCNKQLHNSPCCHDLIDGCACTQAFSHPGAW